MYTCIAYARLGQVRTSGSMVSVCLQPMNRNVNNIGTVRKTIGMAKRLVLHNAQWLVLIQ